MLISFDIFKNDPDHKVVGDKNSHVNVEIDGDKVMAEEIRSLIEDHAEGNDYHVS